ncbi:uncharacterized protein M6B38_125750 [Iris pallida]|uniref:Aminotransferase-like plant mobile domain-containing protein n=1 Tax=Iris pallida TaxID=29817 RepID=A0AAX6GP00_IRIPA|nr:uncharacterized protein M6B38_125750 [Iris pallida]
MSYLHFQRGEQTLLVANLCHCRSHSGLNRLLLDTHIRELKSKSMTIQNDGRIPGGPTTELIKQQRESHICSLIFTGELLDYKREVRCREHNTWRYEGQLGFWKLTSDQEALLHVFDFQYLDQIRFLRHDRDLILSLVERWWPRRNTFQLAFGEMTIVLKDVANILGLPITDEPIIFDESFSAETAIMEYLGMEAPKLKGKGLVSYSWLRQNFMHVDRIGDEKISVDEERVIACTRAYLLGLSIFLFPTHLIW